MLKTRRSIILAIALCALLLPVASSAKQPKEHSFMSYGRAEVILDTVSTEWTKTHSGVATHVGAYSGEGSGAGTNGSGTVTTANGDHLNWTIELTATELSPDGTAYIAGTVTWTGGTGRFENASGSSDVEYYGTYAMEGPVATFTLVYVMIGTIAY